MKSLLLALGVAVVTALVAASCGGDDDDREAITTLPDDTFGIIDGIEDGELKFPVIELWDIPECTCDELITNTPHGTRIRVLAQKEKCPGAPYEVEIAEGPKAGIRGWVLARHITIEGGGSPTN